jgi:3-phosphoshikimate 1-carboxyvinyltransferase
VEIDGSLSSQYVSAVLMAAPLAEGPVEIALTGPQIGARGYVDLTLAAMRVYGASGRARRALPNGLSSRALPCDGFLVEPDASAATYLWAAEAADRRRHRSRRAGGRLHPAGREGARYHRRVSPNMPSVIEGSQMQDAVPTLAVLAAYNNTPVRFTGIENLRVKECDRIRRCGTG